MNLRCSSPFTRPLKPQLAAVAWYLHTLTIPVPASLSTSTTASLLCPCRYLFLLGRAAVQLTSSNGHDSSDDFVDEDDVPRCGSQRDSGKQQIRGGSCGRLARKRPRTEGQRSGGGRGRDGSLYNDEAVVKVAGQNNESENLTGQGIIGYPNVRDRRGDDRGGRGRGKERVGGAGCRGSVLPSHRGRCRGGRASGSAAVRDSDSDVIIIDSSSDDDDDDDDDDNDDDGAAAAACGGTQVRHAQQPLPAPHPAGRMLHIHRLLKEREGEEMCGWLICVATGTG